MEEQSRRSGRMALDSRVRALIPMTVGMALESCKSQNKVIDGQPFDCIVLLGRLVQFQAAPGKFVLVVNDDTGTIKLLLTTQSGKKPAYLQGFSSEPLNKYVKCVATPKLTGDNHDELVFYLNRVEQLQDRNAITAHLTEIILRHLQRQQGFSS